MPEQSGRPRSPSRIPVRSTGAPTVTATASHAPTVNTTAFPVTTNENDRRASEPRSPPTLTMDDEDSTPPESPGDVRRAVAPQSSVPGPTVASLSPSSQTSLSPVSPVSHSPQVLPKRPVSSTSSVTSSRASATTTTSTTPATGLLSAPTPPLLPPLSETMTARAGPPLITFHTAAASGGRTLGAASSTAGSSSASIDRPVVVATLRRDSATGSDEGERDAYDVHAEDDSPYDGRFFESARVDVAFSGDAHATLHGDVETLDPLDRSSIRQSPKIRGNDLDDKDDEDDHEAVTATSPSLPPLHRAGLSPTLPQLPAAQHPPRATTQSTPAPASRDLPELDFEEFLRRMRHPGAFMLTRYFKSFLREFQKKRWTPTEQTRIIHDFIEFTMGKIPQCEPWSTALNSGDGTAADVLDMAREGLEKLVMTKLYEHTFRAVTSNDSALDRELALKMRYFRWVRAEHLDIPMAYRSVLDSATTLETALAPAMRELGQMNRYKAPRDKLVCVMNCCRLIMAFMQRVNREAGADDFLPVLIFTVLKANPENLVSNVQYISRFRNPDKLQSETGYYLTNLMGAVSFIERMDQSSITVNAEEYDRLMTTTIVELEDEETRHQQNARERAAQLERQQLQLTIAEQQQQQASGLGRRLSPNSATSPEGSSPGLRILAKPLQMLGRLFGDSPSQADVLSPLSPALEATNVPWSPVTKATEAPLPAAPIREAPSPPTRASPTLSPADVTPPASSPPTRSLQVPPRPPIKTVSAPRDQFQTSLAPPPSTYTRNHQPLPPPAHIMDEMSATDRSLLEDYELQLAMALSMSMDDRTPTSMAGTPNSNDAAFMAPTPPPASSPSCRAPPSLVKDYSVMSFNQDDPGAAQPSLLDVDPPAMDFAAALTKTSAASGSTAEVPRVPVHTVTSPLRQPSLLDEDFQSSEVDGSITPPMAPTSALMSPNGNNQRRSNGRE